MILEAWIAISSPSLQVGVAGLGSVPPFLLLGPGPLSALLFKAPLPAPFPGSGGHFQTPMAFRARLGPGATRCAPGSQIGAGRGGMKKRWGYPSWLDRAVGDWAVLIGSVRCNRISAIVIRTARSRGGGPGPLRRRAATLEMHQHDKGLKGSSDGK